MSYQTIYKSEYKDATGDHDLSVELQKQTGSPMGGAPASIEAVSDNHPVHESSGGIHDEDTINGSTFDFSFVAIRGETIDSVADIAIYSDIIDSDYRDWKLVFKKDDVIMFEGWIQTDLISYNYIGHAVVITLTATDGLGDLDQTPYSVVMGANPEPQRITAIQHIKHCLTMGVGIALDFHCQVGIYDESLTGETSVNRFALTTTYMDYRQFARAGKDGKVEFATCREAVERILDTFDCTLKQSEGKWWIQSRNEAGTEVFSVNWETLNAVSEGNHSVVSVSSMKFSRGGNIRKISPVKRYELTHRNMNYGDDIIEIDLNDFTPSGPWEIGFDDTTIVGGALRIQTASMFPEETGDRIMLLSPTFTIEEITGNDYIRFGMWHRIADQFNLYPWGHFRVDIQNVENGEEDTEGEDDNWNNGPLVTMFQSEDFNFYDSEATFAFKITEPGEYRLRIVFIFIPDESEPENGAQGEFFVDFYLRSISLRRYWLDLNEDDDMNPHDQEKQGLIAFDRSFTGRNAGGKRDVAKDIYFADTKNLNDLGALFVAGFANTTKWVVPGPALKKYPITTFLINSFLTRYKNFVQVVRFRVYDPDHTIQPHCVISDADTVYRIITYRRNTITGFVEVTAREIPAEIEELPLTLQVLKTRDGKRDSDQDIDLETEQREPWTIDNLFVRRGGSRRLITDIPKRDGVIGGFELSWLEGYKFSLNPGAYYLDRRLIEVEEPSEVDFGASGDLDRVDGIFADDEGNIYTKPGQPAEVPIAPIPTKSEEVLIAEVRVGALSAAADVTEVIVYDENDEWATSEAGVTVDWEDDTDPYRGTLHADVGVFSNGDKLIFTDTGDNEIPEILSFAAKSKAGAGEILTVKLFDGATEIGSQAVTLQTGDWRRYNIPGGNFGAQGTFDKIEIVLSTGGKATEGFLFDAFVLQYTEAVQQPQPVYVHPKGFTPQPAEALTGGHVISQIKVNDEGHVEGVATREIKYYQNNIPDPSQAGEGDTWQRPSDMKQFEIITVSGTRFWVETTSPKFN